MHPTESGEQMSLNWRQFELGVLRSTLTDLDDVMPAPEVAIKLVGETLWHESDRLRALGQYPRRDLDDASVAPGSLPVFGPGLGIASIERPTWDWMKTKDYGMLELLSYEDLAWDLRLNVIACRLRYFLDPMARASMPSSILGSAIGSRKYRRRQAMTLRRKSQANDS